MPVYRATKDHSTLDFSPLPTPRQPGNVPFYVDNIWEWLRPDTMPSRRHAAFGSPDAKLAAAAIQSDLSDVFLVEPGKGTRFCQLVAGDMPEDAKYHADLERLKRFFRKCLNASWLRADLTERMRVAPLFLPCSSKAEIAALMDSDSLPFDPTELANESTFWQDIVLFDPHSNASLPHPAGEIFFEAPYRLIPRLS